MIRGIRLGLAPWSIFGQTALLIIAALLLAQVLTFFLIRGVIDEWQHSYIEQPVIRRFADVAAQLAASPQKQRDQILRTLATSGERFWLTKDTKSSGFSRDNALEAALAGALQERSLHFGRVVAYRRGEFGHMMSDTFSPPAPPRGSSFDSPDNPALGEGHNTVFHDDRSAGPPPMSVFDSPPDPHRDVLRFAVMMPDGVWLAGRFEVMQSFPLLLNPIFLSQAALFVILLAGTLFWASRISRPLRILASAAQSLRPQEQFEPLAVEGPRDVQVAIKSFNAMAMRVRELLQEKDRMLTAIGHDLRTPLASLRIRAETVEPESEREKIVETLDDMTVMVDEILALARLGYSSEPRQLVDLAALADTVVEEFCSLGKGVVFIESPRAPVLMQAGLMRKLLCNLIDNAVKYGKNAEVSVRLDEGDCELIVEDDGPGIPADQINEVLQPFTRLEYSRSRLTGGSGLGLTIADAIARSQGASLILENRLSGGLRATVKWPAQKQDSTLQ